MLSIFSPLTGAAHNERAGVLFLAMKRPHVLLLLALALTVPINASQKTAYQTGKLVDFRRQDTGAGAGRAQGSFCLAVELGDLTYLGSYEPSWRWSYEPTEFVVGDSVEVRINGHSMYLKKPKGGDLKTSITRRERNVQGKQGPNCGLPITSN